jgi:PIN domain nuclease of toxin-antitoxin system
MRFLPDTQILLPTAGMPERLSDEDRDLIEDPAPELVFSAGTV